MPKGLFTATLAVLFEQVPSIEAIEAAIESTQVAGRREAAPENPWLGGESVLIPMRPEVNGMVTVDIVDAPWPDAMGDPKEDVALFGAWSVGAFGPFTFPGSLVRACAQSMGWAEADAGVGKHKAFVRARASYVFGKEADAPPLPAEYDPVAELFFLTELCRDLLKIDGAIACFAPSGEVVLDRENLERILGEREEAEVPPLDVWSNIRFFQLGDAEGWSLMDTVGNDQLEVRDLEVAFPTGKVDPADMASWLRWVTVYAMNESIKDGDTIDGPGGGWRAKLMNKSLAPGPRETLRWVPTFVDVLPEGLIPETASGE